MANEAQPEISNGNKWINKMDLELSRFWFIHVAKVVNELSGGEDGRGWEKMRRTPFDRNKLNPLSTLIEFEAEI